jgi:hypothetical protein
MFARLAEIPSFTFTPPLKRTGEDSKQNGWHMETVGLKILRVVGEKREEIMAYCVRRDGRCRAYYVKIC